MTHKEAHKAARGKQLPERILLWCLANEPARIAHDIADKLCSSFSELAYDELTGYQKRVFDAVTKGGYRK